MRKETEREVVIPRPREEMHLESAPREDSARQVLSSETFSMITGNKGELFRYFTAGLARQTTSVLQSLLDKPEPDMGAFYSLDDHHAQGQTYATTVHLVSNAFDNFIEHDKADGRVTVEIAQEPSGKLAFIVTDNGTGVPPEVEEDLFNPIVSTKDNRLFGGRGIALSYAKRWVQEQGGDLTYERMPDGSKFTMVVDPSIHEYPVDALEPVRDIKKARIQLGRYYRDSLLASIDGAQLTVQEQYCLATPLDEVRLKLPLFRDLIARRQVEKAEVEQDTQIILDQHVFRLNPGESLSATSQRIEDVLLEKKHAVQQAILDQPKPDLHTFFALDDHVRSARIYGFAFDLVTNALDNHIDHGKLDGEAVLQFVQESDSKFSVVVKDNGSGVPEEIEESLFKRKESQKDPEIFFGGFGVGLPLMKEWVDSQEGDLTYRRLDQGSEFTLTINPQRYDYPVEAIQPTNSPDEVRRQMGAHYQTALRELIGEGRVSPVERKALDAQAEDLGSLYHSLRGIYKKRKHLEDDLVAVRERVAQQRMIEQGEDGIGEEPKVIFPDSEMIGEAESRRPREVQKPQEKTM